MAWELIDNIRGPKGDKGDAGTIGSVSVATLPAGFPASVVMSGSTNKHVHFAVPQGAKGDQGVPGTLSSASAESVAAGEPAEVIMSGTTEVKHAHFKVPRGLPGVNAIENDAAVAGYVGAVDSETRLALNDAYPVRRIWDGTGYPSRVPNAVNIFFGPVDPGLLMSESDFWANPDVTTLADVVAAILTPNSETREAVRSAVMPTVVDVPMTPRAGTDIALENVGASGVDMYGWEFPAGVVRVLSGSVPVPSGWSSARVRIFYYVPASAGAGNLRLARTGAAYRSGITPAALASVTNTVESPTPGVVNSNTISGDIPLAGMTRVGITAQRVGSSTADTLASSIFVVGVQLERVS